MALRAIILGICFEIVEVVCLRVITNLRVCVREVVGQNSGHVERGVRES